ncbi:MAG: hypothetical protein CMJ59_06295 [Planctomycetaceae bacterium]|nr:hypothetical protein [Planctomycetaceae bacterium]
MFVFGWCTVAVGSWASAADKVDYLKQIKPILSAKCYACHGALKQEGELRLETRTLMLKGGASGEVIVAGKADESLLIKRITAEENERMPPSEQAVVLTAEEISLIRTWINQGGEAPPEETPGDPRNHWAFKKPVRVDVPEVKNAQWSRNPIDAFLAAKHEEMGLVPVEQAEKPILLRRVYLDLIGLPPTHEQLQSFLDDDAAEGYQKVVRNLLDSPQYGERWGRHWMDVWRYSDWYGLGAEVRTSHRHIWRWRDWIIQSLNENKPYDRMIVEMLAGDEVEPNDPATLRATGFLARNWYVFNRDKQLDDTIEHTSKAFLGLTVNCARCHNHKYDPIDQVDYYRMRAFFEPYQPRLDPVPGEINIDKNGLARVFDLYPDKPTYLFIRGNDKDPDKSRVIQPGVPDVLAFEELKITPVELPPEVFNPDLQSFVLADHLRDTETKIKAARAELEKANQQRTAAEQAVAALAASKNTSAPSKGKLFLQDDFTQPNDEVWEIGPGEWKYADGKLVQSRTGATRYYLRTRAEHPVDFKARLKFSITGGRWRSIGLSFDVIDGREKHAYISAVSPGSKLQVLYNTGEGEVFPPRGNQQRSVNLNEPYELTIAVRGRLVNVAVNGEHALAYEYPIKREPGRLDLIAFDAATEFDSLVVRELPKNVPLVPAAPPLAIDAAKAAVAVAQQTLMAAELRSLALRTAHAADLAKFHSSPSGDLPQLVSEAAIAARKYEVANAEEAVARVRQKLITTDSKTKPSVEKELTTAQTNRDKASKALEQPGEKYTSLRVSVRAANGYGEKVAGDDSRRGPFAKVSTGRRTALARWIASSKNPLTARVAVNHIWLRHFGQPLVESVSDFGLRAEQPTQHALLDWLAEEFMENNWSMKHLHYLIVTSRAYQLRSSIVDAEESTKRVDPENQYYWRREPHRMESQVVRDSLLHLAGVLDATIGGPAIAPDKENDVFRRSLYFTHSRDKRGAFVSMFDDADVVLCYRRGESIIPQQALALANSKLALAMSRRIAARLQEKLGKSTDEHFIKAAFGTVLLVQPTSEETAACREMLEKSTTALSSSKHPQPAVRARENLVQVLLNHNNFVTIR